MSSLLEFIWTGDGIMSIKDLFAKWLPFSKKDEAPDFDWRSVGYRYSSLKQSEELAERRVEAGGFIFLFFDAGIRTDQYSGEEIKCDEIIFSNRDNEPSIYGVIEVEDDNLIREKASNLDEFPEEVAKELRLMCYDGI